jgi:hypothetical protein
MQRSFFFERAWMSQYFLYFFRSPTYPPAVGQESWGWFCLQFLKSAPAFRLVKTIPIQIPALAINLLSTFQYAAHAIFTLF